MKGDRTVQAYGLNQIKYKAFATGAASLQMTPQDRIVRASGAAIAGTVYLPPIADCPLLSEYFIQATSVATGNVTIAPFVGGQAVADAILYECEDSALGGGTSTTEVITGASGWILLLAAGDCWIVVASDLDGA